jgi:hypothetical protein
MPDWDGWSLALWGAAAYLAAVGLARLMKGRYDALLSRLRGQWLEEQHRREEEERRQRQEKRKRRLQEQQNQGENPSDRAA